MKPKSKNRLATSSPTRLILSFGLAVAGFQAARAATWSGAGADANWGTASNWDVTLANSFSAALAFAGNTKMTNTNNLTSGTATSITFNSGAGAFVLGGNSLTLTGNITNSSTNLQTINLPLASTADRTATTATGGGDITLGGLISGAGGMVKAGSGTLLLSGANTFTGNTTVSAGTLKNGSATTFTNLNALILNGTGTFDLNGFNATFAQEGGSLAANTIINNGAADATLKISNDQFGSYAGLVKDGPTNKLAVSFSSPFLYKDFFTNTGNTFSGGLTLLNAGGSGTRLNIRNAIVTVGSPGAITSSTYGTGPITIGQIATDRAGILINVATTLPNAIVFNTQLGNDFIGIRLEAPSIVLSGAISVANSQAAFSGTGSGTLSGVISGANGISTVCSGTLTLSGANTYTGDTFALAGTLKNGSATTFTTKGKLTMNGTGTFDLNGFNASFNNGGGSVAANIITNNGTADATLTFNGNNGGTLAGLVKNGSTNKLALCLANNNEFINFLTNGANTFSGGLTLLHHAGGAGGTRMAILSAIVTTGSPGAITAGTFGTGPITIGLTATDRAGITFSGVNNNTLANAIVFNTALGSDFPGIRFGTTGNVLSGAITANSDAAFSGPSPGSATVSGVISGAGGLSVSEGVAMTLTGMNTYTGDTTVNAGSLVVNGTSIADTNKLVLNGGKLDFTGTVNETVNRLYFGTVAQAAGTYGSTSSGATHQDDNRFSGTGILTVLTDVYQDWLTAYPSLTGDAKLASADPDADSFTNLQEYAFGTDPSVSGSAPISYAAGVVTGHGQPVVSVANITNGVDYRAVFGRRKDYLTAGLTYTVQFSATLGVWVNSTATPTVLATDATMDAVSVPYPLFITTANGVEKPTFFRVAVSSN